MMRTVLGLLVVAALWVIPGCAVLTSPDREFDSNRHALRAVEKSLGYKVDRSKYRLHRVELTDDAITLHYLGEEYPGDQAWVVRFSEKSTELEPDRLATVEPALAVIRNQRLQPGFAPSSARPAVVAGVPLEAATYTFRSTLAPSGRSGRGVLAAVRRTERGQTVIYQIKLDNHGDRERLTPADLAPLVAPLATPSESPD